MGTPLQTVYDAFMARILEDEWAGWTEAEVKQDQRQILGAALPWFKFPRVDLDIDDAATPPSFKGELRNEEIQIIANYMKYEWLNRCIMTWENVKPLYAERDFSQANLIDKLKQLKESEKENALALESVYYRSIKGKPFSYSKLGGK